MAPLPKHKYPKARRGKRQSHMAMENPGMNVCQQCHSPKLSHRACPTCGTYNGRTVLEIKTKKKEA